MATTETETRWLTVPQVAKRMGISRVTAWRKVRAGVIPGGFQTGERQASIRVHAETFERWWLDEEETHA